MKSVVESSRQGAGVAGLEVTRLDRFAAPVALAALALAWPLLDLLGNNAEFFLFRRSPRLDVAVFAVAIGLGIPLLFGLVGLIPVRTVWIALVALLGAVLARLVLRSVPISDVARTGLAVVGGAFLAWAIVAAPAVRSMARYLALAPIVATLLFFFATPTGAVVRHGGTVIGTSVSPANPVPIVWIGFDEFPVASLMLGDGSLNGNLYPNFARLAADGTWFRNAVGVEQQSEQAFPAILTGNRPAGDQPPFAGEYPNSAFSLLGDAYDVTAIEAITRLCPDNVCGARPPAARAGERAEQLVRDTLVVSGHLFLPESAAAGLPAIDGRWGDFGGAAADEEFDVIAEFREQMENDRRRGVAEFVEAIERVDPDQSNFFGFLHILIPHHPWQYLPSGQAYLLTAEKSPGTTRTGWGDDQWLLDQAIQRHLLQAGYADHAMGEIFAALDRAGLYEDAIIVVLADHGIAIKRNVFHQRYITEETIGEVAAVPLFIKGPGMPEGEVDDRRAETIDVLPTIAGMLDVEVPWATDGLDLRGEIDRTESTMHGPQGSVTFGVSGEEKFAMAADIARAFPTGDPYELRPDGTPDLRGRPVEPSGLPMAELTWELDRSTWYRGVDTSADTIPTRISGTIDGTSEDVVVAVVVNGVAQAVVRSYEDDKGVTRFQAMVPPGSLVDGDNRIDLVLVSGVDLLAIPTG